MQIKLGDIIRCEAYYISNGKNNVRIDKDFTGKVVALSADETSVRGFIKVDIGTSFRMVHTEDIIQNYGQ